MIPLPADFGAGRIDAHRLAYAVVAQARHDATERFGLVPTPGGFGTPPFSTGQVAVRQVRVDGIELVIDDDGQVRRSAITTLTAAAAFADTAPGVVAREDDSPELGDLDHALQIDAETMETLAEWFHLGSIALQIAAYHPSASDVSAQWLWPGHFDVAIEIGNQEAGQRATYGASPGDGAHPEPYMYVGAWGDIDRADPYWNDSNFAGASLPYADLLDADDPVETAADFYVAGLLRLTT